MDFKRITRRNHTNACSEAIYRVPLTMQEHDLHIKVQGGSTFVFGGIIDRLGKLEDMYEKFKKDQAEKERSRLI